MNDTVHVSPMDGAKMHVGQLFLFWSKIGLEILQFRARVNARFMRKNTSSCSSMCVARGIPRASCNRDDVLLVCVSVDLCFIGGGGS